MDTKQSLLTWGSLLRVQTYFNLILLQISLLFMFTPALKLKVKGKGKVCIRAIRPELIPDSVAWSDWEYFYSPLDGMLVHRRVTPSIKFAGTHLYTWVERGTVRVKCLAQEHNTMFPARTQTRSARSGVERTNHEATSPPRSWYLVFIYLIKKCELSSKLWLRLSV